MGFQTMNHSAEDEDVNTLAGRMDMHAEEINDQIPFEKSEKEDFLREKANEAIHVCKRGFQRVCDALERITADLQSHGFRCRGLLCSGENEGKKVSLRSYLIATVIVGIGYAVFHRHGNKK